MSQASRRLAGTCAGVVAAGLLAAAGPPGEPSGPGVPPAASAPPAPVASPADPAAPPGPPPSPATPPASPAPPAPAAPALGAFLDSGPDGVARIPALQRWLDGTRLRVGHTYLPGDLWSNIEGRPAFLNAWARWRRAGPDRLLVLNVPLLERNEADLPDDEVRRLLRAGARGDFDRHFRVLAERMVRMGIPDTVVVLGWEMNGTTYTHRCAPDPGAWKRYWRRVVTTMRAVPGQRFRFDFAPNRGRDAIPWTRCYPGDDVVDVIGLDSYDQPPGEDFADHVSQPYGLQHHVDFAAARGKPVSYPEWGLFRNGDNPAYMRGMLEWFAQHRPLYQTITDYCPHGVWQCDENPEAAAVYREALSDLAVPGPPAAQGPSGEAGPPAVAAAQGRETACAPLELGDWLERWLGGRRLCLRLEWAAARPDVPAR
ncbi:glycosyl hydrolase [Streptomyces sp. TRM 70351]|uniref:glycoside hydrolase family 26 protein n=1 Tax=Streptomyces sp. TRM 70351 TaxID=3116552 RepID=UPI002E7B9C8A|nr:glycosyl hydrolase [Streptomyces sp. TRM 70351]MEE1929211.1 glycosyl hydrolase [Streptomyces sp. TRM 70351]